MIKKIAYVIYWNESKVSGVLKKVFDSLRIWSSLNIECKLYLISSNSEIKTVIKRDDEINIQIFMFDTNLNKHLSFIKLVNSVYKFNPELVYFRFQPYILGFSQLAKRYATVIEVNTDDIEERKLGSFVPYVYNFLTRCFIFKNSKGVVYVSGEVSKKKAFTKFNKPKLVLGNGIDLQRLKILPPTNNLKPRLVFIGSTNHPWQGIDKIGVLADIFPHWKIDIIGSNNPELDKFHTNVKSHGYLSKDEYLKIYRNSDCAIGTLALHRKNLNETSALKIIEYLGHGLPVINAYKDTNFPEDKPYILTLPNEENNIIPYKEKIKNFVYSWMGKRVDRKDIVSVDSVNIEKQRLSFFENILKKV